MSEKKQKLELVWVHKKNRPRLEPRILLEKQALSYRTSLLSEGDQYLNNSVIFGDNLLALKALQANHSTLFKCIYIDPPYNSGSAFKHYDDGIEHSLWLSMMRDRLEILHTLLRPDGVLFVSIDDRECAYLTVLLDEIFGRGNYCGQFVWEKKKKPSFLNASLGIVTEYILAYAKDRSLSPAFIGGLTTVGKKYPFNNAGNGLKILKFPARSVNFMCSDGHFDPQEMSEGNIVTRLLDSFDVVNGKNIQPFRLEGEWRYSQSKLDTIVSQGETISISKIPFRPNHVKAGDEPKKMKNLLNQQHYDMSTYEDSSAESVALFGDGNSFDYPKPEKLIGLLIGAVTQEGDWVLDSFAGSGTTGAVAHKMGRRWIMVELGEHCHTHIIPRMKKVVDGQDPGGITEAVGWKGGGGFRYFCLAPSLLEKDKWGNWVVNREYNAAMLAEAMCKHENFTYAPSETIFWQQGRSTERDFIYTTTHALNREQLVDLSDAVGPERSLLICCKAFRGRADDLPNLTIKKIPTAVLARCEFGRDDYSLQIANPPAAPAGNANEPPSPGPAVPPKKSRRKADGPTLFDAKDPES